MEATDIAGQIIRTFESVVANGEAVERFAKETESEIHRLWKDNAELRDELHALANRVETLTRARLAEPAEVAERMVVRAACSDFAHAFPKAPAFGDRCECGAVRYGVSA